MSRERARRREERERQAARRAAEREQAAQRAARRAAAATALRTRLPRRTRWRRQQGLLARRRRIQNAFVLLVVGASQLVLWLLVSDAWVRVAGLVLAVLSVPVLVTLAFDRRS